MKSQFMDGARASAPVCLGVLPVGISFGLLAMQAGFSGVESVSMSVLVMAGASQIMALGMIGQGAAIGAIVLATFFINLRHIVMSSSAMSRLRNTPLPQKLLGSFALCDESFAIFSLSGRHSIGFLLGSNTIIYATWVLGTAIGCAVNQFLPEIVVNSFGIAFYAAFLAMLIPNIGKSGRLLLLVGLTALLNALLQLVLPASWAIISSMVAGAAIGTAFIEDLG